MLMPMRRLLEPAVNIFLPPLCALTGERLPHRGMSLSETVIRELVEQGERPYCYHCGRTMLEASANLRHACNACNRRKAPPRMLLRLGEFGGSLSQIILRIKFGGRFELAAAVAPVWHQAITHNLDLLGRPPVDALIPVPLHWRRRVQRGFNQAEELALALARLGHWPVIHALTRRRSTSEQARALGALQRRMNMRQAFTTRPRINLRGQHVWLIDDVRTSGATLAGAARALQQLPLRQRPASVNAIVLCVTQPRAD